MPIRIPMDGEITRDEFDCICRANAIELREQQREQARSLELYRRGTSICRR